MGIILLYLNSSETSQSGRNIYAMGVKSATGVFVLWSNYIERVALGTCHVKSDYNIVIIIGNIFKIA